jgi:hypothetical protein
MINNLPASTTQIEETPAGIRVTSLVKKDWMTISHGVLGILFLGPVLLVTLLFGSVIFLDSLDNNPLTSLIVLAFLTIVIFGLIRSFKEVRDFISKHETIEIDESGVKIIKMGLLRMQQKIPAEKIRGISLAPTLNSISSLGSFLKPSPAAGQLWIWTTAKLKLPLRVGSGLSSAEAGQVLQKVYSRYPQYQFHQAIDDRGLGFRD